MSKFVDTGLRLEKLATGASFPCSCEHGVVGNGIAKVGILNEYQFLCASCKHIYRVSPAGRLYKVSAA